MNFVRKHLKNERGLTLIELLAVIVILGIIAAIAIPSINGIINKSKDDALKAEASEVLNAAKLYVVNENLATTTTFTNKADTTGVTNPVNLSNYIDTKSTYSITATYASSKFTYGAITVTLKGTTKTFATEADLN